MTFWIAGSAMTALTTIALLVPAFRGRMRAQFAGREQSVYVDQLAELERDAQVGLISGAEAEAARTEIKRRMLKASRRTEEGAAGARGGNRWGLVAAALLVPAIGVGSYSQLGQPDLPSRPFADRADERAGAQQFETLIQRLREKLLADPELRPDGWLMLARSYMETDRPDEAVWAMQTLIDRGRDAVGPQFFALYAELMIQTDDGIVSPKAEAALDKALSMQPDNVAAIFYKAMAYEQSGELETAYGLLRDRIGKETSYQPWMDPLAGRANWLAAQIGADQVSVPRAAPKTVPGPDAADVAAAGQMSAEDRQAFIRSMVQRLADRLAEQPDDLDGWMRLGNAYGVLGETDKARDAWLKAQGLAASLPAGDRRRTTIEQALSGQ